MNTNNDLMNRINRYYGSMSKGQKLLANYIADYYDKAVFLTAAKLGETVGVSESTVVRFAMTLGYKGYPDFQKALEEMVRNKLNSIQRMEVTYGRISQPKILESVLRSDEEKIKETLQNIDDRAFEMAVDTILNADKIYVIGIRSCASLASFLAFYLNLIFNNVVLLNTNNSSEIFEQMIKLYRKLAPRLRIIAAETQTLRRVIDVVHRSLLNTFGLFRCEHLAGAEPYARIFRLGFKQQRNALFGGIKVAAVVARDGSRQICLRLNRNRLIDRPLHRQGHSRSGGRHRKRLR